MQDEGVLHGMVAVFVHCHVARVGCSDSFIVGRRPSGWMIAEIMLAYGR